MKSTFPLASTLLAATMAVATPALADTLDIHAPQIVMQNQQRSTAEEVQTEAPADTTKDLTTEAPVAKPSVADASESPDGDIVSGGIGEDELAHIQSIQKQYDLKLLITEKNGTFISDVAVHIEDLKGNTIVDTTTEGPILLAKLPTGKYKVRAQRNEEVKETKVSVTKGKLHAIMFGFSNTDERDSGDPRTTPLK